MHSGFTQQLLLPSAPSPWTLTLLMPLVSCMPFLPAGVRGCSHSHQQLYKADCEVTGFLIFLVPFLHELGTVLEGWVRWNLNPSDHPFFHTIKIYWAATMNSTEFSRQNIQKQISYGLWHWGSTLEELFMNYTSIFILFPLWSIRIRGFWRLPDGRDCGENWVLFWWAGPSSVNL